MLERDFEAVPDLYFDIQLLICEPPTLLHQKDDGALTPTPYRFCASRQALEPTGRFAQVPAA